MNPATYRERMLVYKDKAYAGITWRHKGLQYRTFHQANKNHGADIACQIHGMDRAWKDLGNHSLEIAY